MLKKSSNGVLASRRGVSKRLSAHCGLAGRHFWASW